MGELKLLQIAPAFAVRDMDAMIEFFGKALGFEARYRTEVYAVLQSGDVQLHLYPEREGFQAGQGNAYIFVQGVDAIFEMARASAKVVHPIANKEYGLRDFLMQDPEGNRIGVAERLESD